MSNLFSVSKYAVKTRAIQLGLDTADGVFLYVDHEYYYPISYPQGTLGKNQTFIVDKKSAEKIIRENENLRDLVEKGLVVYTGCVFCINDEIVGVGSISSFWGSLTESILLTIFVLPELHGNGIGKFIIQNLEQDELFLRANRIEIPASITAIEFYKKQGYDYKNGVKKLDDEGHYRLEKFKALQENYLNL